MHTFLSPLSNDRSDEFGGDSYENRSRWPLRLAKLCRDAWNKPLFVRISASDWAEELGPEKGSDGKWKWWGIEQSKQLSSQLKDLGVDLIDASSGGLYSKQKIAVSPGYQVSSMTPISDNIVLINMVFLFLRSILPRQLRKLSPTFSWALWG